MKHLKSFKLFENDEVASETDFGPSGEVTFDREAVKAVINKQSPEKLQQLVRELSKKLGLSPEQLKDENLVKSKLAEMTKNEPLADETNEGFKDMFNNIKAKAAKFLTGMGLGTVTLGIISLATDAGFHSQAMNAADYTGSTLGMSSMAIASIIALVAGTAITAVGMKNLPQTATAGAELSDSQKAQITRRKSKFGR